MAVSSITLQQETTAFLRVGPEASLNTDSIWQQGKAPT